ncbi:hypothetical protein DSL72_007169 [Monilinia vaccinii-corymbosi]|uniref:Uncharacterized protein n=1 Tax=Monilinia vaccinii-corymbosi TaxID=61207 RepID=A0A8A3PM50_9HELO|nr:hypothetical protein DSL72_007169 [Monilinia vaccinii-corymbosi]
MERHQKRKRTLSPPPQIQPLTLHDLELAGAQFPDEKLASRAEKWARANWELASGRYFWKDNYRFTCVEDIFYLETRKPRYKEVGRGDECKKYLISSDKRPTLAEIDQPKPASVARLVAHKSERQWALPRQHPRHLLNFPQEIIDKIFKFTLVVQGHTVSPDVTTTNKKIVYKMHQTYTLDGERYTAMYHPGDSWNKNRLPLSTIVTEPRYDSHGKYFVLHKVYREMIDATLLRVCRSVCTQATKMLYGGNAFKFVMMEAGEKGHAGFMTEGEVYPDERGYLEWFNFEGGLPAASQTAIEEIDRQVPVMNLDSRNYYHHFIRFLHAIGPTKAAMIKILHFNGFSKFHNRRSRLLEFYDNLRGYIHLISKFCLNLQKLVIEIREDGEKEKDNWPIDRKTGKHVDLELLLRTEIMQLKTVRKDLEVYKIEHGEHGLISTKKLDLDQNGGWRGYSGMF